MLNQAEKETRIGDYGTRGGRDPRSRQVDRGGFCASRCVLAARQGSHL